MSEKPYEIKKIVICNISDTWCEGEGAYHDVTRSVAPDCKNCYIYKDWKKSGLSIDEYIEQEGNEPDESEDDVIRWR